MTLNRLALNNVLRDKWTYLAYFLSSLFSVFMFFCFAVSIFHPDLSVIQSGSTLFMALMAGSILVYIFSFMFISYSVSSFMKARKKTIGLFMITGASKKQVNKIVFTENMFIGIMAILCAIILGLVFSPLTLMLSRTIMNVSGFEMYFPAKAILLTLGMFLIMFFLISTISPRFIRRNKVISMIKSDKTDESNLKFSPLFMIIGTIFTLFLLVSSVFNNKLKIIETLLSSDIGAPVFLVLVLISLYFLFSVISRGILSIFQKSKLYHRKTNMILGSDFKSKLKINVNMMFLVTILLTGAFSAISMLYTAQADVEPNVKKAYPFSYIYISEENNEKRAQNVELLENTLSNQIGYENYYFNLLNKENSRAAVISESDYNKIAHAVNEIPVSLEKNQIYIIRGVKQANFNIENNLTINAIFKDLGIKPMVVGKGDNPITPEGFFNTVCVINDNIYKDIEYEGFQVNSIFAYNVAYWKEDLETAQSLKDVVTDNGQNPVGFFSAGELYETEKIVKNLMLYIGFVISVIFVLAASSMIYFRLITEKEKETTKFRSITKIGLSQKDLSKIIFQNLAILMFVPFIVASVFLFIGAAALSNITGGSYFIVAIICFVVFLLLQSIGYIFVSRNYNKTIIKGLR
ncbi:ABC transporter permease [Alkaliphilus sp. MSJ-5]|uniref:ABC transporter permease n=1 Tax=Alkaliphilus flagellatus TaxID=2841507 RepID=A0ABS6G0C7_9FIRM|nr:ABC transporter permease [Alkaliphilus flagellatus]MBU5675952.1 ABC transporter permease [Alkaliphilus flagellatus]